jgi:glycosyltransferase involved in cell wall biosynthesis
MAVGTPVVAFASGALPEVLGDCGVVVKAGDPQALGAGIARVLGDRDLAKRLGICSMERAKENFSAPATAARMRVIYERVTA